MEALYIPQLTNRQPPTVDNLWKFMSNIVEESKSGEFTDIEIEQLLDFKYGFGNILKSREIEYVKHCYCRPLKNAISTVLQRQEAPSVLDIGSGIGTQAILFGMLAKNVVGLDFSHEQLNVASIRKKIYDGVTDRELPIDFIQANVHDKQFEKFGQFDVIYSHGCIGRFLSADEIFKSLKPALNPGGLVILKTSNPGYPIARLLGNKNGDISTSAEYKRSAKTHGFECVIHRGTTSVPRQLWTLGSWIRSFDSLVFNAPTIENTFR